MDLTTQTCTTYELCSANPGSVACFPCLALHVLIVCFVCSCDLLILTVSPFFEKAARINKVRSDRVKSTPLGQETTLKCYYDGQPPPQVFWTKGKKMLDKCKLCVQKVENLHGVSTLRVTPYRDTDFGDYNCKARNKLGFQHITIKLREDKSKSKFLLPLMAPEQPSFWLLVPGSP